MRAKTRNTFEIVAAGEEGYRWRLVADGCELAESARTYQSRKRVRRAIAALRRADVVDLTSDEPCGIVLAEARFALIEDVEPLIVGTSPRRRKHKRRDAECATEEEAGAADLEAQAVEEAAVARELKGAARSEAAVAEELEADATVKEAASEALEADAEATAAQADAETGHAQPPRPPGETAS